VEFYETRTNSLRKEFPTKRFEPDIRLDSTAEPLTGLNRLGIAKNLYPTGYEFLQPIIIRFGAVWGFSPENPTG
jgi:hypothetical protein